LWLWKANPSSWYSLRNFAPQIPFPMSLKKR
jgi:hypothetical protein